MNLTKKQKAMIGAEICPYCNSLTVRTTEKDIYGKEYKGRDMIKCKNYPECDAYVGCHENGEPLGRLADWPLRIAKRKAHENFDLLWQRKYLTRTEAYQALADFMALPIEQTHIGWFNKAACIKVVGWSREKWKELQP